MGISARVAGFFQPQTTMGRLTACAFIALHSSITGSQTFLNLYPCVLLAPEDLRLLPYTVGTGTL